MLFTTAEASRAYRIPASTIRRWAAEQRLINRGTHRRALWAPLELEQLLDWHRVETRARNTQKTA